jgi:hypothetical protein
MATLFNTKISATYPALIKTIDNAVLAAALKELTDGSGNQTGIYMNTGGDLKVTNVLEWGSLKDTGENITITKLVDQADGIANNNNDTSLPTSKAVKDYVDTKFSQTDTLQEVLTFGNTTSGTDIAVSANDDITFTDSSKILMGAGSDLQIYHDGSNSYIKDTGTGNLTLDTNGSQINLGGGGENFAVFRKDTSVDLYYNGTKRFETTNTGASVTGDLVVSGTITGSGGSFLPLAGGTMTGNIILNDNVKSIYGTSSDGLEIYHDGSNSYINESGTGSLYIKSAGAIRLQSDTGENMIYAVNDSAVNLYFNNVNRVQTTSTGANVSGDLTVTGSITGSGGSFLPLAGGTMTGDIDFSDNVKAVFGAGNDLSIVHDTSNSKITNITGDLKIGVSGLLAIQNNGYDENIASFAKNGAVNLYYDNSKKFETTTSGVRVTGSLELSGTNTFTIESNSTAGTFNLASGTRGFNFINNNHTLLSIANTGTLTANAGTENLVASFVSTDAISEIRIQDDSKYTRLLSVGQSFKIMPNDGVDLIEFNGGTSFVNITGSLSTTASVAIADAGQLKLGTNDDMLIFHDGSDGYIRNVNGQLNIQQSAVTQSIVFKTSDANSGDTTALTISRNADASFGRDVTIAGDLTVNGTTTTINTQTLAVEDPLIELAKDNAANSLDIGFYGKYNDGTARYTGLFMDASSGTELYRLFKGTTAQPTTTVDIGGTGYVAASLVVDGLFVNDYVVHNGDNNTKIGFNTNDNFEVVVGGNANITADTNRSYLRYQGTAMAYTDSTGVIVTGNLDASSEVLVGTNNSAFGENLLRFKSAGAAYFDHNTVGQSFVFRTSNSSSLDTTALTITSDGYATFGNGISATNTSFSGTMNIAGMIYHIGDTNTFFGFPAVDEFKVTAGGSTKFFADSNAAYLYYQGTSKLNTTEHGVAIRNDQGASDNAVLRLRGQNTTNRITRLQFEDYSGTLADGLIQFRIPTSGTASSAVLELGVNSAGVTLDSSGNSTFAGNVVVNSSNSTGVNLKVGGESGNGIKTQYIFSGSGQRNWQIGMASHLSQTLSITPSTANGNTTFTTPILNLDGSDNSSTFAGSVSAVADSYSTGASEIIYKAQRTGGAVAGDWSYDDGTTDMSLGTSTSHSFSLKTGNTRALTISNSQNSTFAGNVKIGTATTGTPAANADDLVIDKGAVESGISIISTTASSLRFGDAADTSIGSVEYNHTSNYMRFIINSAEKMRITSAGDITVSGGDLFLNSGTSYNDKGVVYLSNERSAIISDIVNATANGDTSLDFQTRKSGTRASALFIDEFRNTKVLGSTLLVNPSDGGNASIEVTRTGGANLFLQSQSSAGVVGCATNNNLDLKTNDTTRVRLKNNGAVSLISIKPIGHSFTNGTINNGASVTFNANVAGGNQAAGFMVISAVPNDVNAGGAVGIFTHIHTQGANIYSQLSKREENNITISESGGVFTISNSSGSTIYYQAKTLNMVDFDSTINGY